MHSEIHVSSNVIRWQTTDCKRSILSVVFLFALITNIGCLFHLNSLADIASGVVLEFELNLITQEPFDLNLSLLLMRAATFLVPQVSELWQWNKNQQLDVFGVFLQPFLRCFFQFDWLISLHGKNLFWWLVKLLIFQMTKWLMRRRLVVFLLICSPEIYLLIRRSRSWTPFYLFDY